MKFRRLDENGDWTFGSGVANYSSDNDAILLNVTTRIKSFKNDWFLNVDFGVDWFNLLGSKDREEDIKEAIKQAVLESYGVVRINSLEIDVKDRSATIKINIDTIFTAYNKLEVML